MRYIIPCLAALLLASPPAMADRAAGDACAASLKPEARTIYDATAPLVGIGQDMRQAMTATTSQLAINGKIDRATARESAQAAGLCLEKLR